MEERTRPTKKQQALLEFIGAFIAEHGYGPSYREIMRALEYKSVSTVAVHVNGLIATGNLKKGGSSVRSLEIINEKSGESESKSVSIVGEIENKYKSANSDEKATLLAALRILGHENEANRLEKTDDHA